MFETRKEEKAMSRRKGETGRKKKGPLQGRGGGGVPRQWFQRKNSCIIVGVE